MSQDTSAIDQQIQQFEAQGRWADAASACQKRLSLVSDPREQVRTLEHLVSLYRVKLHDEAHAITATERIVQLDPSHQGALASLRQIYAAQGNHAKVQALDAHAAQQGGSKGILSSVGSSVSGALSTAAAGVSTAAAGVFTAVTSAPVAYEQSPQAAAPPKPAGPPKCPYCGTVVGAGLKTCSSCGGAW